MKAVIIHPGEPLEVKDIDGELKTLQGLVGGYIEAVQIDHTMHMWVDEEGRYKNYLPNLFASTLAKRVIVGTAVIVGTGPDGDDVDCPMEVDQ